MREPLPHVKHPFMFHGHSPEPGLGPWLPSALRAKTKHVISAFRAWRSQPPSLVCSPLPQLTWFQPDMPETCCFCSKLSSNLCVLSCLSHVQLFATLWTIALQAPLFMRFSGQEYAFPSSAEPHQGATASSTPADCQEVEDGPRGQDLKVSQGLPMHESEKRK